MKTALTRDLCLHCGVNPVPGRGTRLCPSCADAKDREYRGRLEPHAEDESDNLANLGVATDFELEKYKP